MISYIECGDTEKKYYELTVLILTYEQPKEKILLSIASAICQKNINLQVVLSDDGSLSPYLNECKNFMEELGFKDYKLIYHDQNEGTVINFDDALAEADGEYIKSFGPGDCFSGDSMARIWLDDMRKRNSKLSFCDSIYYRKNLEQYECVVEVAHPQKLQIYKKKKRAQKKFYLLFNDIFLAAAIVCERKLMIKYSKAIRGMVKFAEDNMFRLMFLDGVTSTYFPRSAIYYEWGDGISTKEDSEFKKAIRQDWDRTTNYICKHCRNNYTENKIRNYYLPDRKSKAFAEKIYNSLARLDVYMYCKKGSNKKRLTVQTELNYLYELKGLTGSIK